MRTYNILFKMPENPELFIAAWSVACFYEKRIRDAKYPTQMILIAKNTWLRELLVSEMTFCVESAEELQGVNVDMAVDFSDDRAIDLGKAGRTATAAFGYIIGIESGISELVSLKPVIPTVDICIIHWTEKSLELSDLISARFADFPLKVVNLSEKDMVVYPEKVVEAVTSSRIVLGRRSVMTYIAASQNRVVIEGYPLDEYHRDFLGKFQNPRYNMVCVEKKEHLDQQIQIFWRTLEKAIHALQRVARAKPVENTAVEC